MSTNWLEYELTWVRIDWEPFPLSKTCMQPYRKNNFLPGMDASILLLCANRHFTGVTVTFYRCFGRFTGFRDGQGVIGKLFDCKQEWNLKDRTITRKPILWLWLPEVLIKLCTSYSFFIIMTSHQDHWSDFLYLSGMHKMVLILVSINKDGCWWPSSFSAVITSPQ